MPTEGLHGKGEGISPQACDTGIVAEMQQILADSAASMSPEQPLKSKAQKTQWWYQRLALDRRVQQLLSKLDRDWLGPWR